MSLVVILLLSSLGIALLSTSLGEQRIANNVVRGEDAFNAAEAGVHHALVRLSGMDLDTLLIGGGALLTNVPLGDATYSVNVTNNLAASAAGPADSGGATNDTDGLVVVTSTGVIGAAQRSVRVVARRSTNPGPFEWGLYGTDDVNFADTFVLTGDAGANDNVWFAGVSPAIVGNAQAVDYVESPATYVTGSYVDGAPVQSFPTIPCPTTGWGPAPTGSGVSFNAGTGDLDLSGSANITFADGDYFFHTLDHIGTGDLVISSGDHVRIFVERDVDIDGGSWVNPNNAAATFQLWSCGSSYIDAWSIITDSTSWFTVYAPNHDVYLQGAGTRNGSYVADDLFAYDSGSVTYDAALAGGGGNYELVAGTWVELPN